ncbi:MAG: hypothetical protein ACKVS6_02070 [Planctomycetota bacterium]
MQHIRRSSLCVPLVLVISLAAACRPDDKSSRKLPPLPSEQARTPGPVKPNTPNPHAAGVENAGKVTAAGIEFEVPKGWKYTKPASTMRVAELLVPSSGGDSADAGIIVFFFKGGAGNFDQNVDRWASQLSLPDGTPLTRDKATIRELQLGAATAKIFEGDGNFTDTTPTGEVKGKIAGAKMIVAMLDQADGGYFFKLTGPARTVTDAKPIFEEMLKSVKVKK